MQACVREAVEETGLDVQIVRFVGRVWRDAPGGGRYVIDDFLCRVVGGQLLAGDDAADARWVSSAEFQTLDLAPGLAEALTTWRVLPR